MSEPQKTEVLTPAEQERGGKPSASSFAIDVECEGRQNLLAELRKNPDIRLPPQEDEYSIKGTRLHKALETKNPLELDEEEMETYKASLKFETTLMLDWAAKRDLTIPQLNEPIQEERLWLYDENLRQIISAKLDYRQVNLPFALIIDRKTGWNPYVSPAHKSWQLKVQAVCLWKETEGLEEIRVAFCKPKSTFAPTDYTDFTVADLQRLEAWIHFHLWRTRQADAPRRPGPHCNYCEGKAFCREAAAYALIPAVIGDNPLDMVNRLQPEDLVKLWRASGIVTKILDAVKERLKTFSEAELSRIGLQKSKPQMMHPIENVYPALQALKAVGLPEQEVINCMKFLQEPLVELLRREKSMSKEGALIWIRESLKEYIDEKPKEASLKELKP